MRMYWVLFINLLQDLSKLSGTYFCSFLDNGNMCQRSVSLFLWRMQRKQEGRHVCNNWNPVLVFPVCSVHLLSEQRKFRESFQNRFSLAMQSTEKWYPVWRKGSSHNGHFETAKTDEGDCIQDETYWPFDWRRKDRISISNLWGKSDCRIPEQNSLTFCSTYDGDYKVCRKELFPEGEEIL